MDWLLLILVVIAFIPVTVDAARGKRIDWRKAGIAFVVAVVVSLAVAWLMHRSTPEAPAAPAQSFAGILSGDMRYFGNAATGDLNGDGVSDAAFLYTQEPGGSGTFFYVVAALHTAAGWTGTNAVLLGDRIAPQTTEIRDGEIIVNYADRKPGEPFTTAPSVGTSMYLRVVNGVLTRVR